jgi:hypothetical protein
MVQNLMRGDRFLFVWYEVTLPLCFICILVYVHVFVTYINMGIQ